MQRLTRSMGFVFCVLCFVPTAFTASGGHNKVAFLTPEAGGRDFQIQGEYEGTTSKNTKCGIQVVATGDGEFDAVLYAGGLPGAGWDGKTKQKLTGATTDGSVEFKGEELSGRIQNGDFSAQSDAGIKFHAHKVFRKSPTLGAKPPKDAIVLFDGSNVDAWTNGKLVDGNLASGTRTKQEFRDFTLHLEFRTPFRPFARGQGRGNSGMYLLDQYECQILDSFGLEGMDNECGGIYKIARPNVNMCFPPLSWQTYDVDFTAAKFDANGKKTDDAIVTIRHNGVVIHDELKLPHPTPGGGRNDEKPGALYLQHHGNPVIFRNIWVVDKN